MRLYYTGALIPNTIQILPEKSLGGFVSTTAISNGVANNLFPTITKTNILQNKKVIRMLALKNTTGAIVSGLRVWTNSQKYSKVNIAVIESQSNERGHVFFELLDDVHSIPFQATLESCEGEENACEVGDLAIDQTVGVWIQRELDQTKFSNLDRGIAPPLSDEAAMEVYLKQIEESAIEEGDEIQIIFDTQITPPDAGE